MNFVLNRKIGGKNVSNKLILVGIAIVAVGMFALPQTLALFSGQHNWYDTGAADLPEDDKRVPCQKCHGDIQAELDQPGFPNQMHRGQSCVGCHMAAPIRAGKTWGGAIENDFHAAAAPMCLDCHSGWTTDARSIQNGPEEVHKPFVNQANTTTNSMLKGANEACIGCHTHVAVNINWTKAYMMAFNVSEYVSTDSNGVTTHGWTVGNFSVKGTAQMDTYGNRTGQIYTETAPVIALAVPTPNGFDSANP